MPGAEAMGSTTRSPKKLAAADPWPGQPNAQPKTKPGDNCFDKHRSDRGSQYLSIKYTERLAAAEIDLSVGTVGNAYDNALAECVIGLFKTEVINQIGPRKSVREVEWETLKWVYWYNNRRLLGPIGSITPAEAEEAFYANLNTIDMVA